MLKSLGFVALALYIIGLFSKAYANSPIGINIDFNTRNGPFFSTIFFASGYYLSKYNTNPRWLFFGLPLFFVGCLLHFSELYGLWKVYSTMPVQDYVFGTLFMGLGVSIMALSNHQLVRIGQFSNIGKLTLGIYLIHFVFVDLLRPMGKSAVNYIWEIAYPILVLCSSIISISLLSKYKNARKCIS
jgi:surface polysaccharide O-acyltransferase-like enzyme